MFRSTEGNIKFWTCTFDADSRPRNTSYTIEHDAECFIITLTRKLCLYASV